MHIKKIKIGKMELSFILFTLYFSMLPLKEKIYPSQFLVPLSLILGIAMIAIKDKKIIIEHKSSPIVYGWLLTAFLVFIYNDSLFSELLDGGVIQYVILVLFIYFSRFYDGWQEKMYNIFLVFLSLHAIGTIIFSAFPNIYSSYVSFAYPNIYSEVMKNYSQNRIAGLCSNYSTNGIYLASGVGISFFKALDNKKMKSWLLFFMFICALLISGKRGPLVFAIMACVVSYIFFNGKKPSKIIKFILTFSVLCTVFFIVAQYVPALSNTFDRFSELQGSSLGGRDILFQQAYDMFVESPLFGHGWGSYKYRSNASVIGEIYGRDSSMLAHNCYLQLLAEVGLIGLILFLLVFIFTLNLTIKLVKNNRNNQYVNNKKMVVTISLYMQLFFVMYCMTGNPLYDYTNLFPYMMSCAIPLTIQYQRRMKK